MSLADFSCCVFAYNEKKESDDKTKLAIAHQTAAFTGAAFVGKLKKLSYYLKDNEKAIAPKISRSEFEEKLKNAERRKNGTKES